VGKLATEDFSLLLLSGFHSSHTHMATQNECMLADSKSNASQTLQNTSMDLLHFVSITQTSLKKK